MLRLERPGRLAAARAETGVVDCLLEGERPSPLAVALGDCEPLRDGVEGDWCSDDRELRLPWVGVEAFLGVLDIVKTGWERESGKPKKCAARTNHTQRNLRPLDDGLLEQEKG